MSASSDPAAPAAPTPVIKARTRPRENTRPKRLPPYAVVLHNDNINGFDFVVGVLMKVFCYPSGRAIWLTLKAHTAGRCVVWTGSLEVAELKVEQLRAAGPDPRTRARAGGCRPLKATAEPMPG